MGATPPHEDYNRLATSCLCYAVLCRKCLDQHTRKKARVVKRQMAQSRHKGQAVVQWI